MSGMDKNRHRNQTVSFRVSPQERRKLEARIIISGMPKGAYIIQSLLQQDIRIVVGKYESDRLSLEFKRLREHIESLQGVNDNEKIIELLNECKTLLNELQRLVVNTNAQLQKSDFSTVKDKGKEQ